MESWYRSCTVLICLVALPFIHGTQVKTVKEKPSHPECIEDDLGMALVGEGRKANSTFLQNNTATLCKTRCKDLRYRFAGTKSKFCLCGDNIKNGTRIARGGCTKKCPGDEREFCGGNDTMSLYRTGFINATTTITPRPTQTETSSKLSSTDSYQSTAGSTDVFVTESGTSVTDTVGTSSTFVSPEAANTEDASTATMVAIYISIPVAIVIAVVIAALIIYLTLRRRRVKCEPYVKYHGKPSENDCHNSHNDTGCKLLEDSHGHELKPDSNLYAEIEKETRKAEDKLEAEYSAVEFDSGVNLESNQQYGHFKAQPGDGTTTRGIYSHLTITKPMPNSYPTENTYSHIGNGTLTEQGKQFRDDKDNTYNTFQSTPRTNKTSEITASHDEQDSVYDHATTGGKHQGGNDLNEYAHLNTVKTMEPATKPGNIAAENKTATDEPNGKEIDSSERANRLDHNYFVLERSFVGQSSD